ncbi:hypothetical protein DDB_G0279719 [Dictyostelium discoideum AX4]|uniref:Probable serine/threonine-protein kinase DDB_G0279719 n=1 Tax=Dictyostelium discoideum TaxID=44689 RepID=Y9719_DICDI|nr:hypothetical protein DDB_G0279719 [Dictyostelium discoideum AX4]Q54WD7.1 RecName: Full=Probable serine/threonine-protein kinase DDB_G0279719 [Dictyostelium discoideum]EAL67634.1 hypothetical protein DDB_G0279719 [Dictyostelium discoideum AX4]|eukprot:XP_641616.1 hypothetical protein DDB_G0279719 [Dictyostelium discoideum AX4]
MNKYEVVKLIGVGGEAKALLVKRINSDKLYVMKQRMFFLLEEANEGLCEAMSLAKIQSPYIVRFEEVFLDNNSNMFSLCIVMEYCEGGDLMDNLFKRISDSFLKNSGLNNNQNNNNNNNNNLNSIVNNNILNNNKNSKQSTTNTNSSGSNSSIASNTTNNNNNNNNINNNNNLKAYENFFSKYVPSETLKGVNQLVEPNCNKDNNKPIEITTTDSPRIIINDNESTNNLNSQSDQILQFSISSESSSFSNNDLINSPNSNDSNLHQSSSNSSICGDYSSPPNLEKISSPGTSTPYQKGSNGNTVNIRCSDIVVEAVSPIKTESIGCQIRSTTSPCTSGPTSPQMIPLNIVEQPPQSTSTSKTDSSPTGADVKKTKMTWWKTYKSSKKDKKQTICSNACESFSNSTFFNDPSSHSQPQHQQLHSSPQQLPQSPRLKPNIESSLNINGNNNNNNCSTLLKLPRKLFYTWIYQICLGVQSIHKNHLVHLDLKSENIFLSESQKIKIGDFGLAKKYENSMSGVAGTYYYLSPEILLNKNYSRPADIFSLGCIFYEMYTLNLLPLTKRSFGQELIEGKFDRKAFKQEFDDSDEPIADLILDMLNLDQNLRPTIDLILQNKLFERISDINSSFNNLLNIVNNTGSSITNSKSNSSNNLNNSNSNNDIINNNNNNNSSNNINNNNIVNLNNSYNNKQDKCEQRNKSLNQNGFLSTSSMGSISSSFNEHEFVRRQLEKNDLDAAADVLCEAFKEEPRFQFVSGATSDNLETKNKSIELGQTIRKSFFTMCVRLMFDNKFMLWGCFDYENKLIAVACWSTPGKSGAPPMTQLIVKILSMLPKFGFRTMKRIGKIMSNIDKAMKNHDSKLDVYYLPYIGVSKEYRDLGVGQYLLKPVIEWAEHQRKTVKAVVFSQKQINFFSKLGLSVGHTEKITNLKGINSIYVMSKNSQY